MSHQVRQVGKVVITDVNLLKRAIAALTPKQLGLEFGLHLDENLKQAQYYAGNFDKCDMVITANRTMTADERARLYDIAVKIEKQVDPKTKQEVSVMGLWADTHGSDHGIGTRINLIMQRYLVEKRRAEHVENGAIEVTESINDRGQITVNGVYMRD